MPLKGKYIKYSPEITLEIFTLIYNKLINSGWTECSDKTIEVSYSQFKTQYNHLTQQQDKIFNTHVCPYEEEYAETTVQEILGYNPFVKEVIPEYVDCVADAYGLKKGNIYKVNPIGFILGANENIYYSTYYVKPSTKKAFDAQNKPKQSLKQAVHCKTQEEWDFVKDKLKVIVSEFKKYGDCIDINAAGTSFYSSECEHNILSFQEWCDLNGYKMEKEVKFEVGKWYKNLGVSNRSSNFGKFLSIRNGCEFWMSECIYQESKVGIEEQWLNYSDQTVECSLEEIQQYLPDNHPDRVTPVIQQTRDMQKSNQEFKVGDWIVIITDGNIIPKKGSITVITYNDGKKIMTPELDKAYPTKSGWLVERDIRHATTEEINNHLISIGQIPMDIQSGSTSDKAYNRLISYGNKIHEEFFNPTVEFERNYDYTVNPKYKQEFNIINKTKTIKF